MATITILMIGAMANHNLETEMKVKRIFSTGVFAVVFMTIALAILFSHVDNNRTAFSQSNNKTASSSFGCTPNAPNLQSCQTANSQANYSMTSDYPAFTSRLIGWH